jgi:hypothetical protein
VDLVVEQVDTLVHMDLEQLDKVTVAGRAHHLEMVEAAGLLQ